MKSTLMFQEITAEDAMKISAFAASLGATAEIKKVKSAKTPEPDPEEADDEEEDESPKSAKASKSGSKAGVSSSKVSKKPAVVEEDEYDEDEEDEEIEDEDEDDEKPKGYQKGKANLEGIKELAKALADKGKEASTKKILLEFGAKVVSKIDPADYIPVYTRLLKLLNKSK